MILPFYSCTRTVIQPYPAPPNTASQLNNNHHRPTTMLPFLSGSSLSNTRQSLSQVLNFALVLSTAFMLWKALSIFTASSSPIVVVLSGSMEPAFQRGDLLFLWNRSPRAEVGEIVVYNVKGKDIPIVHRVVRTFSEVEDGKKTKKKGKKIGAEAVA